MWLRRIRRYCELKLFTSNPRLGLRSLLIHLQDKNLHCWFKHTRLHKLRRQMRMWLRRTRKNCELKLFFSDPRLGLRSL
jgi:hypothetical protein